MWRNSFRVAAVAGLVGWLAALQPAAAADVVRVGEGPFITGGGFYVANDRGYFKKMGLDIQVKKFNDGALAVPACRRRQSPFRARLTSRLNRIILLGNRTWRRVFRPDLEVGSDLRQL